MSGDRKSRTIIHTKSLELLSGELDFINFRRGLMDEEGSLFDSVFLSFLSVFLLAGCGAT